MIDFFRKVLYNMEYAVIKHSFCNCRDIKRKKEIYAALRRRNGEWHDGLFGGSNGGIFFGKASERADSFYNINVSHSGAERVDTCGRLFKDGVFADIHHCGYRKYAADTVYTVVY